MYHDYEIETYESISRVLEVYYAEKMYTAASARNQPICAVL